MAKKKLVWKKERRARANYRARIAAEWQDEDGYWIELKSGWQDIYNPTCHTITENTKAEAHSKAKDSAPCDCKDCQIDRTRKPEPGV